MTTFDSDATHCTEIENADNNPQSLQIYLTGESASAPMSGSNRYNLRRSQQNPVDQNNTDMQKQQRIKEMADLRLRLKQIQERLRKEDVAESPALEQELDAISEKIPDKRTKMAIQAAVLKLRKMRDGASSQASMVPQISQKSRGIASQERRNCKPRRPFRSSQKFNRTKLKSKIISPRVPNKRSSRVKALNMVSYHNDSDGLVSLDKSILNETSHKLQKMLNKSINLYNQKIAQPYHMGLNNELQKLKDIMTRAKDTLQFYNVNQEKQQLSQKKQSSLPVPSKHLFDPFLAPYTESLFSATDPGFIAPSAGPIASTSAKVQSTFSYFNDSNIPLAQKDQNCSVMEYDQIMETSCVPGSSFNSNIMSRDLFCSDAYLEHDKSVSFFSGPKNIDQAPFELKANEKTDDKELCNENHQQDAQNFFTSEVPEMAEISNSEKNCQSDTPFEPQNQQTDSNSDKEEPIDKKSPNISNGKLFSPTHLRLLARRLYLNEIFLKCVINETFHQASLQDNQMVPKAPEPLPMETDCESHVSNTPQKILKQRALHTRNHLISNNLFNIPIDDSS